MDKKYSWQEIYEAALLELHPEALQQRIGEAEKVNQQRIAERRRNHSSSAEECHALDDALRMLRFLASTECKIPRATVPGSTQGQADHEPLLFEGEEDEVFEGWKLPELPHVSAGQKICFGRKTGQNVGQTPPACNN